MAISATLLAGCKMGVNGNLTPVPACQPHVPPHCPDADVKALSNNACKQNDSENQLRQV
ncbi:hypothetical protein KCP69_19500 [Salmonella enterica subsp. enterica]|nr:hypothetical protein KCP69_19500 [Salmonella enterica subsp. enterica]